MEMLEGEKRRNLLLDRGYGDIIGGGENDVFGVRSARRRGKEKKEGSEVRKRRVIFFLLLDVGIVEIEMKVTTLMNITAGDLSCKDEVKLCPILM